MPDTPPPPKVECARCRAVFVGVCGHQWASVQTVGIQVVGIVGMLQAAHDHANLGLVWRLVSRRHRFSLNPITCVFQQQRDTPEEEFEEQEHETMHETGGRTGTPDADRHRPDKHG